MKLMTKRTKVKYSDNVKTNRDTQDSGLSF